MYGLHRKEPCLVLLVLWFSWKQQVELDPDHRHQGQGLDSQDGTGEDIYLLLLWMEAPAT